MVQHIGIKAKINRSAKSLTSFDKVTTITMGTVKLDVYSLLVINTQTFMIIDKVSPYNGILGRP
ncbi:unnamed protein product [Prunus armeniaca]